MIISEALKYCRAFEATDPKDKVLALVDTLTSKKSSCLVDYNLSVAQAYANIAKHII